MRDRYETVFGLYNHDIDNPDRPLALVGLHQSEDTTTGGKLYERIDQFTELQVFKWFGLNLTEFLDLPTDIVDRLLVLSAKMQAKEGSHTNDILGKLEEASKKS